MYGECLRQYSYQPSKRDAPCNRETTVTSNMVREDILILVETNNGDIFFKESSYICMFRILSVQPLTQLGAITRQNFYTFPVLLIINSTITKQRTAHRTPNFFLLDF